MLVLAALVAAACGPAMPADGRPYGQVVPPASAVPVPGRGGAAGEGRYLGAAPPPVPADVLVVYLDGWGARLRAADDDEDDARSGTSRLVALAGRSYMDVPPFEGTTAEWAEMQACMAQGVVGLPIVFTERPPERGHFMRLMIGGEGSMLGHDQVWGVATRTPDKVLKRGIGFVFSTELQNPSRLRDLCWTGLHELGHLLGLDHSAQCDDVMAEQWCEPTGYGASSRAQVEIAVREWTGVVQHDPTRGMYNPRLGSQLWPSTGADAGAITPPPTAAPR